MSAKPISSITNPNYQLHDWLWSLGHERTKKLYRDLGVQLILNNVPIEDVEECYFQLAVNAEVKLDRLTGNEILQYSHVARASDVSGKEQAFDAVKLTDGLSKEIQKKEVCKKSGHKNGSIDNVERSNYIIEANGEVQSCTTSASLNEVADIDSASGGDEPQINQNDVDITNKSNIQKSFEHENELQGSNVKESSSVVAKPQTETKTVAEEKRSLETISILNSAENGNNKKNASNKIVIVKSKINKPDLMRDTSNTNQLERKSVIKKSRCSLKTTKISEKSKIANDTCIRNNTSNNEENKGDIGLNNIEANKLVSGKPHLSKSLDQQLGIVTDKAPAISGQSNENRSEDGMSNVSDEAQTSNTNLPSRSKAYQEDELLGLHNLQEKIAKDLSKKNVPLPTRTKNTPILTGEENIIKESTTKKSKGKDQRPIITVRENLYAPTVEKTDATQTNDTHILVVSHKVSRDSDSREPRPSSSSSKVEERKKRKDGKSKSPDLSTLENNLVEQMRQFNSELASLKKAAESKKRLSLDLESKTATAKKRRLSEHSSASRNKETPAIEKELLKDNEQVAQERTIRWSNSSTGSISDGASVITNNAVNNDTFGNPTLTMGGETNITSNMAVKLGQQTTTGESTKGCNSDSVNKQSASVLEKNPLLERLLSKQLETESVPSSSAKVLNSLPGNLPNISSTVTVSQVPINQGNTDSFQPINNRPVPEICPIPNYSQATSVSTSETTQTTLTHSNQVTNASSDINRLLEKAINRFLVFFCNRSDENLSSIPAPVRSCLNQYCLRQGRPQFTRLREYLKLYMGCFITVFKDEELRKTVGKVAELLHLSIADFHRQNERKNQAARLQSVQLRKEEVDRAEVEYKELLYMRGKQLAIMFLPVLSKLQVSDCHFLMLVTFYFKVTQVLLMIDLENETCVFTLRGLMKSMLLSSNSTFSDFSNIPVNEWLFFKIDFDLFKECCTFVKQCLLTLYLSGYRDEDIENFWKFKSRKPVIYNLANIIERVLESSGSLNTTGTQPTPPSITSNLQPATYQNTTAQTPSSVGQQISARSSNSSQLTGQPNVQNNFLQRVQIIQPQPNVQNTVVQNRIQNNQQPQPSLRPNTVRAGNPSQLPSFASWNQVRLLPQMNQRIPPTPSNTQANQGLYNNVLGGVQWTPGSIPSPVPYPQLGGQGVRFVPRAPPPYPGANQRDPRINRATHQQINQATQQRVNSATQQQQQINQATQQLVNLATQQQQRINPATQQRINPATQQRFNPATQQQQQINQAIQVRVNPATQQQQQRQINQAIQVRVNPATQQQQQINPAMQQRCAIRINPATQQQRVNTQSAQLWQPDSNAAPQVSTNHQNSADNANLLFTQPQVCATAGCNELATLVCSLCKTSVYCTTQCQTQDWYAKHSQACPRHC